MQDSETVGLASYQQTVSQTPGFASSIWVESTNVELPIIVHFIPTEVEKEDKKSLEPKTV